MAGYQSPYTGAQIDAALDKATTALQPGDVDDTPANGETAVPVSSNWAFDHAAATAAHGVTGAVVGTTDTQTLTNKTLTNPTVNGFTGDTSVINIGSGQIYKDTAGNLGLGVTPSAWANHVAMDVKAAAISSYFYLDAPDAVVSLNAYAVVSNSWRYKYSSLSASVYRQANGEHQWHTAPSGTAGNTISFTQAMTLDASGWLTIGTLAGAAGPVYADANGKLNLSSSDARLKENIAPLTACLSKALVLNPVSFQWRDKASMGAKTNIGFIAQDMEAVVPEVVGHTVEGMKTLDYAKLVALLTGAIQEQQALIEQLNLRIAALEGA